MRKINGKKLILGGVLSIIVLLAGADAALRIGWGLGTPLLYQDDPDTGYIVAPSQDIVRFHCHNQINKFSMRSPEVSPTKPSGEFRLLAIGDSVTYGTSFVDQPLIFTSLLARDLPGRLGRPVEVLNASAGGWAVGNELGYLRSRGTLDADLVMLVINTGDLAQPFAASPVDIAPSFPSHDPSCALAELLQRYILPRFIHQNTADAGSTAIAPDLAHDTPRVLDALNTAMDLARARGAQFMLVYSPFNDPSWASYAPALQLLKNWSRSKSVELLDLTDRFSTESAGEIYFPGNVHLKEKGDAIAASAMADDIVAHYGPAVKSQRPATTSFSSTAINGLKFP